MAYKETTTAEKKWVEQTLKEGLTTYAELFKTLKHLRRMRALRLDSKAPRSFQKIVGNGVRVPMSWSLVQTVVGLIAKNDPVFKRLPRNAKDKDASQRIQNASWPLIQSYSKMAREELYYLVVDQLAGDGRSCVKLRRKIMEGYPEQSSGMTDKAYNKLVDAFMVEKEKDNSFSPLRVTRIDPMTVMPDRGIYGEEFFIEHGKRNIKSVMNAAGLKFGLNEDLVPVTSGETMPELIIPSGMQINTEVTEIWTDNEVFLRIGSEKIIKMENEFGFIPYRQRFGQVTSIPDPVLEGTSVIFPFAGVEPWLNTLMSVLMAWSVLGGTPILAVHTAPGTGADPGDAMPVAEIPLGKMVSPGVGKQLQFVVPPPVGREVIEAINLLMSVYEKTGITSMARGFIGTRTAGTAYDSALEQAAAMFTPLVRGAEGILEDIVELTLRGVEALDMPMWVTGYSLERTLEGSRKALGAHKIDPKDIDGYYGISCELELQNLQDTISRGMHGAMMQAHGLWAEETSMEFSGITDVQAERIKKVKDKIRKSPLYQEQIVKPALEEDPDLKPVLDAAQEQGLSVLDVLMKGTQALQDGGEGAPEGETGKDGGRYGGAGQPKTKKAPGGGGKVAGAKKRPGGARRGTPQGEQMPK